MARRVSHSSTIDDYDEGKEGKKRSVYFEEESSSSSSSEDESPDESEEVMSTKSHRPPRLSNAWSSFKLPASLPASVLAQAKSFRLYLFAVQNSHGFNYGIAAVILVNSIFIAIDSYLTVPAFYVSVFNNLFLAIYVVEMLIKLYVWRVSYFKNPWNVFDFIIVGINLLTFLVEVLVFPNVITFNQMVVLQVSRFIYTLRLLRVLRVVSLITNLQIIVSVVLQSIPAMSSTIFLVSFFLYIFAVIGRGLYGDVDPARFGNLLRACDTLFQLLTLDDWFSIYTDIRDKNDPSKDHILVYLVLFIFIETFMLINLFTAVIVDNFIRSRTIFQPKSSKESESDAETTKSGQGKVGQKELRHWRRRRQTSLLQSRTSSSLPGTRKTIKDYFPENKYTFQENELLQQYFEQLVLLEHHMQVGNKHQHTLYALIDLLDYS